VEYINDGILISNLSIAVSLPDMQRDEETVKNVFRLLLLAYGHLRGKDFAKRKNALAKSNLTVGHRQQIAAISNPKLRAKGSKKKTGNNTESAAPNATRTSTTRARRRLASMLTTRATQKRKLHLCRKYLTLVQ